MRVHAYVAQLFCQNTTASQKNYFISGTCSFKSCGKGEVEMHSHSPRIRPASNSSLQINRFGLESKTVVMHVHESASRNSLSDEHVEFVVLPTVG